MTNITQEEFEWELAKMLLALMEEKEKLNGQKEKKIKRD